MDLGIAGAGQRRAAEPVPTSREMRAGKGGCEGPSPQLQALSAGCRLEACIYVCVRVCVCTWSVSRRSLVDGRVSRREKPDTRPGTTDWAHWAHWAHVDGTCRMAEAEDKVQSEESNAWSRGLQKDAIRGRGVKPLTHCGRRIRLG